MQDQQRVNLASETLLGALIVGGGPAGVALLLAARRIGLLRDLLSAGLIIIERTAAVGPGEIGNYAIRSDSLADSFLAPVTLEIAPPLQHLLESPAGKRLNAMRGSAVELTLVADFLADLSTELQRWLVGNEVDPFVTCTEARHSRRQRDGTWVTECWRANKGVQLLHSRTLVLATGAEQPIRRLFEEEVAGLPLLPRFVNKTIQSGELLGHAGAKKIASALSGRSCPRVAIIGASHSAIASAHVCLESSGVEFGPCAVTVLHREDFRLTYGSPAKALEDGYHAFGALDICPKTGRVFPLAGLRSDSRDLMRRFWGLGGLAPECRLQLLKLEESRYAEANQILEEAHLIVAALGYCPRALPLFDQTGEKIPLLIDLKGPLVDGHSRVLDAARRPVPGVFAMGLATGYPLASTHGEPSFAGQANGVALWQSDVGEELILRLLDEIGVAHGYLRHPAAVS